MNPETLIRHAQRGTWDDEHDRALSDLLDEAIADAEEQGNDALAARLQAAFDELTGNKKLPPPEEERPACKFCGTKRTPICKNRQWSGKYKGPGNFCTFRCAAIFANDAYRAGYRTSQTS